MEQSGRSQPSISFCGLTTEWVVGGSGSGFHSVHVPPHNFSGATAFLMDGEMFYMELSKGVDGC